MLYALYKLHKLIMDIFSTTHLNLPCKPSTFISEDGQIMLNLEVAINENIHRHFASLRRFRKRFSLRNLSYIIV